MNSLILSAQFWPSFREEKIELPEIMNTSLETYTKAFETLKGNRTLNWKPHLGQYNVNHASLYTSCAYLLIYFYVYCRFGSLTVTRYIAKESHKFDLLTSITKSYLVGNMSLLDAFLNPNSVRITNIFPWLSA